MSEHQAKKLFDSMSNISDELVEEAYPVKSARQKKPWLKWCAAAACLCLVVGGVFAAIRSTGNPILRAEDIWQGAMLLGDSDTTEDYSLRHFDTNEAILTSPVRDERDAQVLSVYRSMAPKSSDDNYQLLLTWADELTQRAKDQLGIKLVRDQVYSYQDPYDSSRPETNEFSNYYLEMPLIYQGATLTLRCTSEGSLTYYWLSDIEQLYTAAFGSLALPGDASDAQLLAAVETLADFVNALTGKNYTAEDAQFSRSDNQPDKVSFHLHRTDLPGTDLSREMLANYGNLSIGLEVVHGRYEIRSISLLEEYYELVGDYELISLAEAEEFVRKGLTFGGVYCALCRAQSDLPALDFSDYDYVQVEYYNTGYAVPHYAFYKRLETVDDGGGETYGVVYVPAVKVQGVKQFLHQRAQEHASLLHAAEN